MGNASSILQMEDCQAGGFGGSTSRTFSWAAVETFSAASRTKLTFQPQQREGPVRVSAGGCTATNVGDCLATAVAFARTADEYSPEMAGTMPEGWQFDVLVECKSDTSVQYSVGLVRDHTKTGQHTLERMWGYSSSGDSTDVSRAVPSAQRVYTSPYYRSSAEPRGQPDWRNLSASAARIVCSTSAV